MALVASASAASASAASASADSGLLTRSQLHEQRAKLRRQYAVDESAKHAERVRAAHSAARAAHRARQAERQAEIISFNTEEKKVRLIFVLRFRK